MWHIEAYFLQQLYISCSYVSQNMETYDSRDISAGIYSSGRREDQAEGILQNKLIKQGENYVGMKHNKNMVFEKINEQ